MRRGSGRGALDFATRFNARFGSATLDAFGLAARLWFTANFRTSRFNADWFAAAGFSAHNFTRARRDDAHRFVARFEPAIFRAPDSLRRARLPNAEIGTGAETIARRPIPPIMRTKVISIPDDDAMIMPIPIAVE